jgi:hypothetical protein
MNVERARLEKKMKSDGLSTTEIVIALVILAVVVAICAMGLELRRHIL